MKRTLSILFFCILIFVSCNLKFEKEKWNTKSDIFYDYREKMVKDLMKNHLKKGMTYNEVIELLGTDEISQNNTISYEIMVDFGWNIDPQRGKILYIEFTNDSIVKEFWLEKWEVGKSLKRY